MYICILIISMFSLYFSKKMLGKLGLTLTFVVMSIVSFILSFKYITISTINLNSNCITYITMLISLYLMLENSNKKEARDVVNLNFMINIFFAIMIYLMTNYTQSLTDTISINMKNVFVNNTRILIIYPITTFISGHLLIWTYEKIKKLYDNYFITTVTIYLLIGIIEGIMYTFLVYGTLLNTDADESVKQEIVSSHVHHILSRSEMILDDVKFMYAMNDTATPLETLLMQLIRFFKSYTVDILDLDIIYVCDFKPANMIKIIEKIAYMEKTIDDAEHVQLSYSDTIHKIMDTIYPNDKCGFKDRLMYNASMEADVSCQLTDKVHKLWYTD